MLLQLSGHFAVVYCPGEGNCREFELQVLAAVSAHVQHCGWAQGSGWGFLGFSWVRMASFTPRDVGLALLSHVSLPPKSFALTHSGLRWSLWEALLHCGESLASTCEAHCFPEGLAEFGWVSTHTDNQGNSSSFGLYNGQNANIHEEGGTHLGALAATLFLSAFWSAPASLAIPVIWASSDTSHKSCSLWHVRT